MENKIFSLTVKELIADKSKLWKIDEIEQYLKSKKIRFDRPVLTRLLLRLVEDDVFKWLDYVCYKIADVVSTEDEFLNLLKAIVQRISGDMVQGVFIRALIGIGEKIPELGLSLSYKMLDKGGDLIFFAAFPLGGAGKVLSEQAFGKIVTAFEDQNPQIRATSLRALRVIFEKSTEVKRKDKVFRMLDEASRQEDIIVRNEAANTYLDFIKFEPDACISSLMKLARVYSDVRSNLAYRLRFEDVDGEEVMDLLEICSRDDNDRVLSNVSNALARHGKRFPEKSLEIIRGWIRRNKYFKIYMLDWSLQEIGKDNLDRCIETIERWLQQEMEPRFLFLVPYVLKELAASNYEVLVRHLKEWSKKNKTFQEIVVKTLREILSTIYPSTGLENLVGNCFSILSDMARAKNLDINRVIGSESDKIFQCLKLAEEIELDRKPLDYDKIEGNLENYPAIKQFLGIDWFKRMRRERNNTHPLLLNLSYEAPDEERLKEEIKKVIKEKDVWTRYLRSLWVRGMLRPKALLTHINGMLETITSRTDKVGDLRDGLKNEEQFWQTVSEMEVISAFIPEWTIELGPEVDGKKLDGKVDIDGQQILLEVINPEMFKPLRLLSTAVQIPNRAKDKIYDEFKKHLAQISGKISLPIIIVIDIGRSEIDYDFVENYLMGTLQLTIAYEKTGKAGEMYPSRAKGSMHELKPEMDIISAVVCYKYALGNGEKFHLQGKIILNQHAKNPLSEDLRKKIEQALFK